MMNNPSKPLVDEILLARDLGFDYLDLTLEPPATGSEGFNRERARKALAKAGLPVVGHTGWHLPGNAAYPEVRQGVVASLSWALEHFAALGARTMTYHIQGAVARYVGIEAAIAAQAEVLAAVAVRAEKRGMTVVLEHTSAWPEQFRILDELFRRVPALGFHLDVGHANLAPDRKHHTAEFIRRYGRRLCHVHFSDNRGAGDDHLPLGVGTVPWPEVVRILRRRGYSAGVTLETFSADHDYLRLSLEKARAWFA